MGGFQAAAAAFETGHVGRADFRDPSDVAKADAAFLAESAEFACDSDDRRPGCSSGHGSNGSVLSLLCLVRPSSTTVRTGSL
jgi:hypothetical protein